MIIGNFYIKLDVDKELYYVSSQSGGSRRYHLFHIGFDNYCRDDSNGTAWTFNVVIPFASFGIGWIFHAK
ncbi:TMhelix containing protein [Vibrio phage 1.223.O._10N.261.48.A9]|nr:TMhelix containing protein [Vibrio phage 1.223.O._10N.261.48.A9]